MEIKKVEISMKNPEKFAEYLYVLPKIQKNNFTNVIIGGALVVLCP